MKVPLVSIVCPVYNEESFISRCIDSLIAQNYPNDLLEIYFVDGMSTDHTRHIIQEYCRKYSNIHLLDNPNKIVPPALNLGIRASKGEVVIRVDGHCFYPYNYISTLVYYLYELNADNVGAVWNTLPAKKTSVCKAIAIGVSHKFGIGNSLHKTGIAQVVETDTVPFGCFRRSIFDKIGLFDNDLIRNQDDEFNARIIKSGGKIYLIPDLKIDYYARGSIGKMAKMFYQYGLFKPLVNKKLGSPATIRQFFPVLFLLGLVFGALLFCLNKCFAAIYIVVLFLYITTAFTIGLVEARKMKDWKILFLLPIIFVTIHVSYGWGYLKGIYNILRKHKFNVDVNR